MLSQSLQRGWSWTLRNLLVPAGDRVFGFPTAERLSFLEQAQWWNRERILQQRDRALRETVEIAVREVPYYRDLFQQARLTPADIRSAADLARLPISTKAMLREHYPAATTRPTGYRTHVASSSGSTGANFYVLSDSYTTGWYRAAFLLALQWAGWQLGMPHLQTGMTSTRSLDRRLKDALMSCYYESAFNLTDAHLDAMLQTIERKKLRFLFGYPGSLYCLAVRARKLGWNQPLQVMVTWGDNLYPHYRRTVEEVFSARVFDTYGCGEGIQVAAQCGTGANYHVHSLDTIVEVVDDHGQPCPAGVAGNIVLTRLHPGPMPLIRYQLGDRVELAEGECPCGRGLELLRSIQGRDTDIILTPAGNRLIVHFFTGLLEMVPEIRHFQVVQDELESIRVRVVPDAGFTPETSTRIVRMLAEAGCADLKISIEPVEEIPTTASGKRRFVISKLARPDLSIQHENAN